MRLITSLLSLLLSLGGCNEPSLLTASVRDHADGVDRLHSQSRVRGGEGRFECMASLSGHCHYAVYDAACPAGEAVRCHGENPIVFDVAVGEKIERVGLPLQPRVCVRGDHSPSPAECSER